MPVTTTRLMQASSARDRKSDGVDSKIGCGCAYPQASTPQGRRQCVGVAEQTDLEVDRLVDELAVGLQPAVGDAEHQPPAHHPLDFDAIVHVLHRSAAPGRRTSLRRGRARRPCPASRASRERNPSNCHSASRPRQPGITGSPLKWQGKNHRSGLTSSSARTRPLPYSPPVSADLGNAVEHQHRRQGNCGPSGRTFRRGRRPAVLRNSKLLRRFSIAVPIQGKFAQSRCLT